MSGTKKPLVIIGAQAWKSDGELKLLNSQRLSGLKSGNRSVNNGLNNILKIDYLPFPLLVSVIRGATATIFPSLYEGFGLPVLESMILGTPVITSNTASMPEVVGAAGLMVDPYSVKELSDAIYLMDNDNGYSCYCSGEGILQAKKFSVENYNEKLDSLYKNII